MAFASRGKAHIDVGTVIEHDGEIKVRWDDGKTSYYRHGHEANVELILIADGGTDGDTSATPGKSPVDDKT